MHGEMIAIVKLLVIHHLTLLLQFRHLKYILLAHDRGQNTILLTMNTAGTIDLQAYSCCVIETSCPWLNAPATTPHSLPLLIGCV